MQRKEKVMTAEQAVEFIKDGDTVAVGGAEINNKPLAILRALIRRGVKDIRLVNSTPGSVDSEMLIGANCVKEIIACHVGADYLYPVGPRYKRYIEQGKLAVLEHDQGQIEVGLRAAAQGLPFLPTRSGLGTDVIKVNHNMKVIKDPFLGETLVAVPAIKPDVAIIHVSRADKYGNGQHSGLLHQDRLAARASDKVIIQAEEIVEPEVITADPLATTIFSQYVVAVVEAPFGSHPCGAHGHYPHDEEGILECFRSGTTDEAFKRYLDKFVFGVKDHLEYLELVGIRRLLEVKRTKDL